MAFPTSDQNLVGTRVKPVTDLALVTAIGNATVNGTAFSTGLPGTVVVLAKLATGSGTINIRIDATAAAALTNVGSPTASITLASSGTSYYATVDTSNSAFADALDPNPLANTSDLFVLIQEVGGVSGFQLSTFAVLVLFELRGGEDWFSIRHGGLNAVAGTVGQGALQGVNNTTYVAGYQDGAGNLQLSET